MSLFTFNAAQAPGATRHEQASLVSCAGEPLKRNVGHANQILIYSLAYEEFS